MDGALPVDWCPLKPDTLGIVLGAGVIAAGKADGLCSLVEFTKIDTRINDVTSGWANAT